MKKLVSLLVALMLIVSVGATALAATADDGTITITAPQSIDGRTFAAYKLASITDYYGNQTDGYTYNYVATELLIDAIVALHAIGTDFTAWTNQQYIEYVAARTTAAQRATLAAAIEALVPSTPDYALSVNGNTATATDVEPGYYIVIETTSDAVLAASHPGASRMISAIGTVELTTPLNINIKSTFEDFEKTVRDESGVAITDPSGRNYKIGDTVNYQLDALTPAITDDTVTATYTFTDTMGAGLTFNDDVEVVIIIDDSDPDNIGTVDITDYVDIDYYADTYSFELDIDYLEIKLELEDDYDGGLKVVVTYSADINENAKQTTGDPLDNEATLVYPNMPTGGGLTETVSVYTYGFKFQKVDADDVLLDGAEFTLYATATTLGEGEEAVTTYSDELTFTYDNGLDAYIYDPVSITATTTLIGNGGEFIIFGLDAGTYYLVETKAPEGYNLLTDAIVVTIEADVADETDDATAWTVTANGDETPYEYADKAALFAEVTDEQPFVGFSILNSASVILPGTGGIGTKLFTIFGGTAVLFGAAFLFFNKKRLFN